MKFLIITQAGRKCVWCERAARLLDEKGLAYAVRPLDFDMICEAAQFANMNTVPIIYHGQRLVGGYAELEAYVRAIFA